MLHLDHQPGDEFAELDRREFEVGLQHPIGLRRQVALDPRVGRPVQTRGADEFARGDIDPRAKNEIRAAGTFIVNIDRQHVRPDDEQARAVDIDEVFIDRLVTRARLRGKRFGGERLPVDLASRQADATDLLSVQKEARAIIDVGIDQDLRTDRVAVERELGAQVVGDHVVLTEIEERRARHRGADAAPGEVQVEIIKPQQPRPGLPRGIVIVETGELRSEIDVEVVVGPGAVVIDIVDRLWGQVLW